jgi:hypothetical protein
MLYYFVKSNYIQPLHNQDAHSCSSLQNEQNIKKAEIHTETMNYITPKEMVELQSVDYAVTHVGKKYPSP